MSQAVSHFSLPGMVAKVEGDAVNIYDHDQHVYTLTVADVDAFVALLKAAAKSASNEAVKVIGKPRAAKNPTKASSK